MSNEANEEGKAKALRYYKIIAVIQGMLGVGMLLCGIIAAANVDEDIFGPPYFVGGFIVGIMALLAALLCTCVIIKAPAANSDVQGDVKKQELRCAMQGHYMLSMFMIMGCFVGTVLCGIGGFAFDRGERSSLNKSLAVVIMLGCIFGLVLTVASLCLVCTYGTYFGVVITQQRRGRMAIVMTNTGGQFGTANITTTEQYDNNFQPMFNTGNMDGGANGSRVSELERQNQLLREQLELQAQLNQQQQQQQPQYGGGFSQPPGGYAQPPAPGMYNAGPAYPPNAPPPSYDEVKQ